MCTIYEHSMFLYVCFIFLIEVLWTKKDYWGQKKWPNAFISTGGLSVRQMCTCILHNQCLYKCFVSYFQLKMIQEASINGISVFIWWACTLLRLTMYPDCVLCPGLVLFCMDLFRVKYLTWYRHLLVEYLGVFLVLVFSTGRLLLAAFLAFRSIISH